MSKMIDRINKMTAEIEAETARINAGGAPKKVSAADWVPAMMGGFVVLVIFGWLFLPNNSAPKTAENILHDRLASGAAQCMEAVRNRSKFPSKTDFAPDMIDLLERLENTPLDAKTFVYHGRVDLMNGFGAMIPHRYACTIDVPNWKFTEINLAPG